MNRRGFDGTFALEAGRGLEAHLAKPGTAVVRRFKSWCVVPLLESHKAKVRSSEIGILTPAEFARLLESASDETLPYWALGGFTGLRTAELERLDWAEVHFDF
jgi:integrase